MARVNTIHAWIMRRLAVAAVILVLSACDNALGPSAPQIEIPSAPVPVPAELQVGATDADVIVYPRSANEYWVYDSNPEYGMGSHVFEPADVIALAQANVRIARTTLQWKTWRDNDLVNGTPYREGWDWTVRWAQIRGLELLVVVHTEPQEFNWTNRDQAFRAFAADMEEMARRYPTVRFWELFNEQNVGFGTLFGQHLHDWNGVVDREVPYRERGQIYGQMLKLAYPAIKRGNPDAWVVYGGITGSFPSDSDGAAAHPASLTEFVRGTYEVGARDFFDIMNVHSYGVPLASAFRGAAESVLREMARYGDAEKPLINTEFGIGASDMICHSGWPSGGLEEIDRIQEREMRAAYEWAESSRKYWKVFPYQLFAEAEMHQCAESMRIAELHPGVKWNDYGHGLMRSNRKVSRPTFDFIREFTSMRQPQAGRTTDVVIETRDGDKVYLRDVPVGSQVPHILRLDEHLSDRIMD